MTSSIFSKKGLKHLKEDALELMRTTYVEIVALGVLGLGISLYNAHEFESRRSQLIPLAFSEIGQLMRDAERDNRELSATNIYLPKTNDLVMKVFEAHNEANTLYGNFSEGFAQELDYHMNMNNIYRFNLRDLIRDVPKLSEQILIEKHEYKKARDLSARIVDATRRSWTDDHTDVTHTECDTDTDEDGNTTTTCYEVYDYTIHDYDYYEEDGELAFRLGKKFENEINTLSIEKIYTASQTNADGEYAAEKSRKFEKDTDFQAEDYLNFSRTWFHGSTLLLTAQQISILQEMLPQRVDAWGKVKGDAESARYTTYSSFDSGPHEFQVMENYESVSYPLYRNLNEFVTSIEHTKDNVAHLEDKIDEYMEAVFYPSKKKSHYDLKEVEQEILDTVKDIYQTIFKEGIDLKSYRKGFVALIGLAGAVGGSLLGAGLDVLGQRTGLYDGMGLKKKPGSRFDYRARGYRRRFRR